MTVHLIEAFSAAWKCFYFSLVSTLLMTTSNIYYYFLSSLSYLLPVQLLLLSWSFSLQSRSLSHSLLMSPLLHPPTHCSALCSLAATISPPLKIFSPKLSTLFLFQNSMIISLSSHLVSLLHKTIFSLVFCSTIPFYLLLKMILLVFLYKFLFCCSLFKSNYLSLPL